ncbi:MAG: VOC family protein [Actinomycetes bacterium]
MALAFQVTFDAHDPEALGKFWGALLGYVEQPPPEGHDSWESFLSANGVPEQEWQDGYAVVDPDGNGPRIYLQKVPEGKTVKNRMHLDVDVGGGRSVPLEERQRRVDEGVTRAVGLGATRTKSFEEGGGYFVVMADPEGNEFCLH